MNPSNKIMNPNTLPIDIQTTLFVDCLDFPECDSFATAGPSACLVGTRPEDGGAPEVGVPGGAPEIGVPGGAIAGERGEEAGVVVPLTLNGFPACLNNKYHL